MSKDDRKFNAEFQLDRLTSRLYVNPYDVLELGPEANETEIKKKHRLLSVLVHPDKNSSEKAAEAFNAVDSAYKTLMDVDKRRTFQRVMREAKERVEVERKTENERRKVLG